MPIDDKHDYKTLLKLIDSSATQTTLANKLSALGHDTEDVELKKLALKLAARVRPNPFEKPSSAMICLRQLHAMLTHESSGQSGAEYGQLIEVSFKYCSAIIASKEPAWHTLARRAGWTPPAPAADRQLAGSEHFVHPAPEPKKNAGYER